MKKQRAQPRRRQSSLNSIIIRGAREHNLRNLDLVLPRNKLIVMTGLSGSGKSSLAFDTLYAEGQRRYVESLSTYARQFLGQMDKPAVDSIEGLSPAISIDQKTTTHNPRSTVGTVTEIYDYLRLLFARIGRPHCPDCGQPIARQTVQQMVDQALQLPLHSRVMITAPVVQDCKGEYQQLFTRLNAQGFSRVYVDGVLYQLTQDSIKLAKNKKHTISVVIDRLVLDDPQSDSTRQRLTDSLEQALQLTEGLAELLLLANPTQQETNGNHPPATTKTGRKKAQSRSLPLSSQAQPLVQQTILFSEHLACSHCQTSIPKLEPRLFSFNNPKYACSACSGLGKQRQFDRHLIIPNHKRRFAQGAIIALDANPDTYYMQALAAMLQDHGYSLQNSYADLDQVTQEILWTGSAPVRYDFHYHDLSGFERQCHAAFKGLTPILGRQYQEASFEEHSENRRDRAIAAYIRQNLENFMSYQRCQVCQGARLQPGPCAVQLNGLNIHQVTKLSVTQALAFFTKLPKQLTAREQLIAQQVLKEIRNRLQFLQDVGLDYLTLDRSANTLSGGEAQRIRLATQIGSALTGILYVLDEPSIGLHQRDNRRLIDTLKHLRDLGNTVVVVEHDEETMRAADQIVDIGPGAGEQGGRLMAQGTAEEIAQVPESITGSYLAGRMAIAVPKQRRTPQRGFLEMVGATAHNLQNLTVRIPIGLLTVVTGVSGSGKSTLVNEVLYPALTRQLSRAQRGRRERTAAHNQPQLVYRYKYQAMIEYEQDNEEDEGVLEYYYAASNLHDDDSSAQAEPSGLHASTAPLTSHCLALFGYQQLDKVINIDQTSIGRTPRSNPATYTGIFDFIRQLFSETPEAKARGYRARRFSFNVKGGRCEACMGDGVTKIEMNFLPDVYVPCEVCRGQRYNRDTLEILYKGQNIAQVLNMTVSQACLFLQHHSQLERRLRVLEEVGLGYLRLGQPATTLSGGEAQRIKLAAELMRVATGKTLYILDEPTTGLHTADVQKLLTTLHRLVDRGNSVVVIEHNLDVIKTADYIIDLGPEGGDGGGQIIADGTPEEVASCARSYTGAFLAEKLS